MDGLRVTYVWDLPAGAATPGARYAKAPTALPGFAPPKIGEPLRIPETQIRGVLEWLALTGLGLPSRRWEQDALSVQGLGGAVSSYRAPAPEPRTAPGVELVLLATAGLDPDAANAVFTGWVGPPGARR